MVDRFLASYESAPSWVKQNFLALAATLGDLHLIPALVQAAVRGHAEERPLAVSALAAITGWDVRFDAGGSPRPVAEAAADYERECSK